LGLFLYLYFMTIKQLHALFLKHPKICSDTRKVKKGDIFFALKGDTFDGNTFASKALEQGASFAIIDNAEFDLNNKKTILVKDTLKTLQELAKFHRNYLGIPIIALTGSNGKTTTKELIHSVLSEKYNTIATLGNLNNHIGVPLTLLTMNSETEIGIVEMGANHPTEINFLCHIANPDFGYITNFGKAHLEGFGSIERVIEAKTELYRYIKADHKIVFINANDPIQLEKSKSIQCFSFGNKDANSNVLVEFIGANPFVKLKFSELKIESYLIGTYNFSNIAAAIAIGTYFKVPKEAIKRGIENYTPNNNRSQIINKNGNTILLDAYNANPSSMKAAIENFEQLVATKKVLLIGDMFELGKDAEKEHQNIVDLISSKNFDVVYFIGKNFFKTIINKTIATKVESFEDAKNALFSQKFSNCSILIKGSRGMALERLLEIL